MSATEPPTVGEQGPQENAHKRRPVDDDVRIQMNRALRQTYRAQVGDECPPGLLGALTDACVLVAQREAQYEYGVGFRCGERNAGRLL